jgi:hypothetical protein
MLLHQDVLNWDGSENFYENGIVVKYDFSFSLNFKLRTC